MTRLLPQRSDDSRSSIGRYQLLDAIGQGSMGIVYSAHDPELDRKIALKVLHASIAGGPEGHALLRERLRREAQTMARLSHPNIVAVFDIGMANDQLFIAMELIEGATLGTRLASRSVAGTLDLFLAAGRGLAAAHAAGFVHRDFKPANVLVGANGRVCVSDFGLARIADDAAPLALTAPAAETATRAPLETGLVGSPAYLAPEQLRGGPVDARADQFSFCVALYEAVYGQLPFSGRSLDEPCNAIVVGAVRVAPRGAKVPQWLRAVILRGLSARAVDRFPSMTALLDALERGRARKWRRALVAGLVPLAVAAGLVAYRPPPPACANGAARVAGIHDVSVKARIHAAFARSGKPYAEDTWNTVARALDDFAAAWQRSYLDVCVANLNGQEAAEAFDLRMDCLNHGLNDATELTSLFEHADGNTVEHALQAVQGLATLDRCADVHALRQHQAPPNEPRQRAAYDALERQLAHVKALGSAYRYVEVKAAIGDIVSEAERLHHPLLLSDALFWQGMFQRFSGDPDAAERSLARAAAAAERGADDGRAASAWDQLAFMDAQYRMKEDDAERWLAHGAAAGQRAEPDAARAALHERAAAQIRLQRDHFGEQATALKRSIELYQRAGDIVGEAEAAAMSGFFLALAGQVGDADSDCERAERLVASNLGREHPSMGPALLCLGTTALMRLRLARATSLLRRSVTLNEAAYGADSPRSIASYQLLVTTLLASGHLDEAELVIAHCEDVERRLPSVNPMAYANTILHRGQLLLARGRAREALPLLETSYRSFVQNRASNGSMASGSWSLAQALWQSGGDRERAVQLAKDAGTFLSRLGAAPAYLVLRLEIWSWLRNHPAK